MIMISLETSQIIKKRIQEQTSLYLPFINIINVNVDTVSPDVIDANELNIAIEYVIEPLNLLDKLQLKIV